MPKELPGGSLPPSFFRVPVEWSNDQATAIRIEHFDFESLDSLSEQAAEIVEAGGNLKAFLEAYLTLRKYEFRCEGMMAVLAEILERPDYQRAAVELAFATGLNVTLGLSGPELAKHFKVTKEALFQGIERVRRKFGGALMCGNQRDGAAREKMRARNWRRVGP